MQKTEPLLYAGPASVLAAVGGFWFWFLAVEAFHIDTRGLAGSVTSLLWLVYLAGVPFTCAVTLGFAALGAIRKRMSWTVAGVHSVLIGGVVLFWYWSLTSMRF